MPNIRETHCLSSISPDSRKVIPAQFRTESTKAPIYPSHLNISYHDDISHKFTPSFTLLFHFFTCLAPFITTKFFTLIQIHLTSKTTSSRKKKLHPKFTMKHLPDKQTEQSAEENITRKQTKTRVNNENKDCSLN